MLDLDFAFFNLSHDEKRGLVYRKYLLNRLAPVFFSPRVEKLIELGSLDYRGCQISMPLGPGNLSQIELGTRRLMMERSAAIAQDYRLERMAVDRRLKRQLHQLSNGFPLVFGDNFIKALAAALIARALSRRAIKRIIMVGEVEYFPEFISAISAYGVPVSIQTASPSRYEVMTYRLLYEKGCAVSNSLLNPQNWERGDLVFVFDPAAEGLVAAFSLACCVRLTDYDNGLAPELEERLNKNGMVGSLYNLAPILETCMLAEAGFLSSDEEKIRKNHAVPEENGEFLLLRQIGDESGLWDLFLDKAI